MREYWKTAGEIARVTNYSVNTIEAYGLSGKIAKSKGKYGLISAVQYKIKQLEDNLERAKNDRDKFKNQSEESVREAKERKLIAEANKEEAMAKLKQLEVAEKEGTLINAEIAAAGWSEQVIKTKFKILAIPRTLAAQLSNETNSDIIEIRITEALNQALIELGE
ncbi:MAG: hypothetical protein R3321_10200 [Nitrososphaeraceae archaeon]|nr:hypothetical protein [Nitrososphaeraceae archaeon]